MNKVKHLLELPNACTHLALWKADLAEESSYDDAFQGCEGVFHVASPMELLFQDQVMVHRHPLLSVLFLISFSLCLANSYENLAETSYAWYAFFDLHKKN